MQGSIQSKEDRKISLAKQPYGAVIHADFTCDGELVAVERPWVHVMDTLPEATYRKTYGT